MIPVLVLCDDYWHPAEVVIKGFQSLDQKDYAFDFVTDPKDILTPEMIKRYPVIANCKTDTVNAANQNPWFVEGVTEVTAKEFGAYIEEGGGFLSLHSGNTNPAKEKTSYALLVGNFFIGHPPRCPVEVKITGSHPIVQGVENFTVRDEHYKLDFFAENYTELFKTVSETGGTQIGGYAMERGKGRVCVMTPGHTLSAWQHPSYRKLLLNALGWCVRR